MRSRNLIRSLLLLLPLLLFPLATQLTLATVDHAVGLPAGNPSQPAFDLGGFLAPFHSVLLHFPISFIALSLVLEVYYIRHPSQELRRVILLLFTLATASTVLVASLGLLRARGGGYDRTLLFWHGALGLTVASLVVATFLVARASNRRGDKSRLWFLYRGLIGVTLCLVIAAGHFGGSLSHGSTYLLKNAPGFLKFGLKEGVAADRLPAKDRSGAGKHFVAKVRPILLEKCAKCHGAEMHMNDYRLDLPEFATRGGKSGLPAIVPGEPTMSNLVRLILRDENREGAMPPAGMQRLTPEETMTLIQWIENGAHFSP